MEKQNDCFATEQKATDAAMWQNFAHRAFGQKYDVNKEGQDVFRVVTRLKGKSKLPKDYSRMSYQHIDSIRVDDDPLEHWGSLMAMLGIADGELLRFLLLHKVPLEKFIRCELASRGYDENHNWVGYEKAAELWMK